MVEYHAVDLNVALKLLLLFMLRYCAHDSGELVVVTVLYIMLLLVVLGAC
jgi:hypothetical protein